MKTNSVSATLAFERHLKVFRELEREINYSYIQTKNALKAYKKIGISIFNTSLPSIKTELIKLNYLILQHIWNCEVYHDLLFPLQQSIEFQHQLKSLILVGNDFINDYNILRSRVDTALNNIKLTHPLFIEKIEIT